LQIDDPELALVEIPEQAVRRVMEPGGYLGSEHLGCSVE
jgi:hypothetical protein